MGSVLGGDLRSRRFFCLRRLFCIDLRLRLWMGIHRLSHRCRNRRVDMAGEQNFQHVTGLFDSSTGNKWGRAHITFAI